MKYLLRVDLFFFPTEVKNHTPCYFLNIYIYLLIIDPFILKLRWKIFAQGHDDTGAKQFVKATKSGATFITIKP